MNWRGAIRRFLPYVIAVAGGFSLAYLYVAFVVFPSGVVPRDLKVPNVIGLSFDDAARRLVQAGFGAERGAVRSTAAAPKGTVLAQNPPAGGSELAGTKVTLDLSSGQQLGTVPSVLGLPQDQAEAIIDSAGFTVGEVSQRPSDQAPGRVVEMTPRGGVQAPVPSGVSLVVSSGPAVVSVPDVVGRRFLDAQRLFQELGLGIGDVATADGLVPADSALVTAQSPAAGAQVQRGARISLRVSGGGPTP